METPASIYEPSPRTYPEKLAEIEYPDSMLVRTVKSHGHFRWNKHDVFLSEVLWGEPIGLLPVDEKTFRVYYADVLLGTFFSSLLRVMPLSRADQAKPNIAAEGDQSPPPAENQEPFQLMGKLSGMCPV
jgi:hypothetical protein